MDAAAPPTPIRIVHLEDSPLDHDLVLRTLRRSPQPYVLRHVDTLEDFEQAWSAEDCDVILADYRLTGFTAMDAWQRLQGQAYQPPFILLSGAIGEAAAVAAIQQGMSDYLLKDDISRLDHVIQRSLEVHQARLAKQQADAELAASQRQLAAFAEHLQLTIEQERTAIAREIHDDIGGSLAAVKFDLAWIGRHSSDVAMLQHVTAATDMLQHAIGASQRIMMNLRPAILDQGLVAAVEWLAGNFERRTAIKTSVRASRREADVPKAIQMAAYRTAQEALTNIGKHARCDSVKIDISADDDFLTLEVSDNGPGISTGDRSKPKSFGLRGLHERAKSVGGWLDISSISGQGTSIIFSAPITSQADPAQEETP
ncbi:MAG: hypothetical protein RJA34_1081 [Pseudomonadota bacterium]